MAELILILKHGKTSHIRIPPVPDTSPLCSLVPAPVVSADACRFLAVLASGRLYALNVSSLPLPAVSWEVVETPGPVRGIASGPHHAVLAVASPGVKTIRVMALGSNESGACGIAVCSRYVQAPVECSSAPRNAVRVFASAEYSAATTPTGSISIWGGLRDRVGAKPRAILRSPGGLSGDDAVSAAAICDGIVALLMHSGAVFSSVLPDAVRFDSAVDEPSPERTVLTPVRLAGRATQILGCGGAFLALLSSGHIFAWGAVPLLWLAWSGRMQHQEGYRMVEPSLPVAIGTHAIWRELFVSNDLGPGAQVLGVTSAFRVVHVHPQVPQRASLCAADSDNIVARMLCARLAQSGDFLLVQGSEDPWLSRPSAALRNPLSPAMTLQHRARELALLMHLKEHRSSTCSTAWLSDNCAVSDACVHDSVKESLSISIHRSWLGQCSSLLRLTDNTSASIPAITHDAMCFAVKLVRSMSSTRPVQDELSAELLRDESALGAPLQLSTMATSGSDAAILAHQLRVPGSPTSATDIEPLSTREVHMTMNALLQASFLHSLNDFLRHFVPSGSATVLPSWLGEQTTPDGLAVMISLPHDAAWGTTPPANSRSFAPLNWFERRSEMQLLCALAYGDVHWRSALGAALSSVATTTYSDAVSKGAQSQHKRASARAVAQTRGRELGLLLAAKRRQQMEVIASQLAPDALLSIHGREDGTSTSICSSCTEPHDGATASPVYPPASGNALRCHSAVLLARAPALATTRSPLHSWCITVPRSLLHSVNAPGELALTLLTYFYLGSTPFLSEDTHDSESVGGGAVATHRTPSLAEAGGVIAVGTALDLSDLADVAEQFIIERAWGRATGFAAAAESSRAISNLCGAMGTHCALRLSILNGVCQVASAVANVCRPSYLLSATATTASASAAVTRSSVTSVGSRSWPSSGAGSRQSITSSVTRSPWGLASARASRPIPRSSFSAIMSEQSDERLAELETLSVRRNSCAGGSGAFECSIMADIDETESEPTDWPVNNTYGVEAPVHSSAMAWDPSHQLDEPCIGSASADPCALFAAPSQCSSSHEPEDPPTSAPS
jgi:hypothetical protein